VFHFFLLGNVAAIDTRTHPFAGITVAAQCRNLT